MLVVDNYDSFVYNLVQYLGQLGVESVVRRNDEVTTDEVAGSGVDGVLLSPGPKGPWEAGVSVDMVRYAAAERDSAARGMPRPPGHRGGVRRQLRARAGAAARQDEPGLPHRRGRARQSCRIPSSPRAITRSPSTAKGSPAELEVTATTESGVIMGLRHRELPIEGVQFHPESVLTYGGHLMLARWLAVCGDYPPLELAPALTAEVEGLRAAAFS